MKVSIIIPLYKDIEALELILDALQLQTYKNFEVIVAEDDDSSAADIFIKNYIKSHPGFNIIHNAHENIGRTKTTAQNKAICTAGGEYLIFLDGDCLPYSTFVEGHVALSKDKRVLSGRRVNGNTILSKRLRQKDLTIDNIEKNYIFYALSSLMWDKSTNFDQGIYYNPHGLFYKNFIAKRERSAQILGCNFSCYKKDIVAINGFDESYGLSMLGDDTDLDWRFLASGCELFSCKNVANVVHLEHGHSTLPPYDVKDALLRYQQAQKENRFVCIEGLSQYCEVGLDQ